MIRKVRKVAYWLLWLGPIVLVKVALGLVLALVLSGAVQGFVTGYQSQSRFYFLGLFVAALLTYTALSPNDDMDFGIPAVTRFMQGFAAKLGLGYHCIIGLGWLAAAAISAFKGNQFWLYTSLALAFLILIHDIEAIVVKVMRRLRPPLLLASL